MKDEEQMAQARDRALEKRRDIIATLNKVMDLCEADRKRDVIPFLMFSMRKKPYVRDIRLSELDGIMNQTKRRRANKVIRRVRETIPDSHRLMDGYVTLGWALESKELSQRMALWLFLLSHRDNGATLTPPDGFPWSVIYANDDNDEEDRN